ncbi:proline-rich transmembrane protein 3 [Syngnathoides biaculeatus]|uniref:proline-rich transmembrane protein 3 n=1 Tax=Syngnathoides biaculeatus TaxID=300417 RepID=UPI002ADDD6A9|nr:proline-rich transmembrane protein 3 [Syngnathoides biaculeatus]XP_061687691.1 proline-rich transmembrane protein 3 [Syngnathoides biaculeatus]
MASMPLLFVSFLISSLHPCDAQVIFGTSPSFSPLDLPKESQPTKQTDSFWSSFPPTVQSPVPAKVSVRNRLTITYAEDQGSRTHSAASTMSTLSSRTLSGGKKMSRPTITVARMGSTSPSLNGTVQKEEALMTSVLSLPSGNKLVTASSDLQGLGSGSTMLMREKEQLLTPMPTTTDKMAQYQPHVRTKIAVVHNSSVDTQTLVPQVLALTTESVSRATPSPVETQATPRAVVLTGELTPPTDRKHESRVAGTLSRPFTTTTVGSIGKKTQAPGSKQTSLSKIVTEKEAATTAASLLTATELEEETPTKAKTKQNKSAYLERNTTSTTVQSTPPVTSSFLNTSLRPVASPSFIDQKNHSILSADSHQASKPSPSPNYEPAANGSLIYWSHLNRSLTFAWALHVYGSVSLFLLLFATSALGLILSPSSKCPHRGALALANALLFLVGGLRASLFLIDPYGTQKILPRSAVAAIYNLPLHLLVWTQAALALLALRVAGVTVLPSTLERPPLVAVLAVLQCTLLLAADLLSPALSPVVPVTLQVLSLCWGLGLCIGFVFYLFPRIRCPPIPHPGVAEEARRKGWTGSRRERMIFGKVLAVCAVVGVLCCGLHVHATLWLYGLLGDWMSFNWGWWLVHFWARLLELTWGLCLLFLASWVFWRPQCCRGRDDGGAGDGITAGDMPSPGHSGGSTYRHTCWSKIVQSLTGKPCRKSDCSGVGGGGQADMPNNWAGQERSGVDITKTLIRNNNHDQTAAPPEWIKDSNRVCNHRGTSAERGICDGSAGSLLRLQALGLTPQHSVTGSLDPDRETSLSMCEFDLRPPSPINLTRSIDEALHREHLVEGGSLFHSFNQNSQSPSPGSGVSPGPWLRRNSDPQFSESSEAPTESSMPLGGSILSSVPSRQVTAPPTPSHQGHRWAGNEAGNVPSSVSCPVSLHPSRLSTGHLGEDGVDDTRPFITPDSDQGRGRAVRPVGSRSYLEVSRRDDSASVSSEIIDL